jgi:DNA-directed RNA polymerase subunit beta'
MAYTDPKEAFEDLKAATLEGLTANFPITGKKQTIELDGLEVKEDHLDPDDIETQHEAKVKGKSWAAPIYGNLVMRNTATGDVVDRKRVKLGDVPHMTKRHAYIVNGGEFQVDNQWRLKPGVYVRRTKGGVGRVESQFNVPNRSNFAVTYDQDKRTFKMKRGKSEAIPVYPLMKELGVDDDELEKTWGKEILEANKSARAKTNALEAFFKADKKRAPKDKDEARQYFHQVMRESELRKDSTELTMGKSFDHINGDLFKRATTKMIKVMNGDEQEDERDSLVFKDLRTAADHVKERLTSPNVQKAIKARTDRKIDQSDSIRQVIKGELFSAPLKQTFTSNALSRDADQVNPVEMLASSFQTTVMGAGGIQSDHTLSEEVKLISPSHLGFLDPVKTPEGGRTGVTLRLPMGVEKSKDGRPVIPVYNVKTGKMEQIDPLQFHKSRVVLPDQVKWEKGKPKPIGESVVMSQKGNEIEDGSFNDAQYVLTKPSQMFSMTTNLIPFLGNNSGNRATYAATQMEQAISLQGREKPLVQSGTGSRDIKTFEDFVGRNSAQVSDTDGEVIAVNKKHVSIKRPDGTVKKVGLYNNFPLNDQKSVLTSEPKVKVGQKVKKGDLVADNNFTEDGSLALGTNLVSGYVPFKGLNFEDGVVISESAAKKMSSVHMHKPSITVGKDLVTDVKNFYVNHPTTFTKDQKNLLGDDGVVKVGQKVMPGDPLVLASKPYESKGSLSLHKLRKSMSNQHMDQSLTWKSDYPGEVVGVHRNKKGELSVHVKTIEPMQIGDKMTGRAGNKGIVTAVLPDSEMPQLKKGLQTNVGAKDLVGKELQKDAVIGGKKYQAGTKIDNSLAQEMRQKDPNAAVVVKQNLEVALNPSGVPGRMNMGQVLETAAAKIAKKTGKPYVVENFRSHDDAITKVQKELKDHGLEDQEDLVDPVTGQSLGKALVGPQHLFKLNFQIDKKVSVRSGMHLEGAEPEGYDPSTLIPQGGGKTGGQSMGNLGMYSLLAHGAKSNIREMQTWKSEGPDPREKWDSQHIDVWKAMMTGEEPPPPKKTFAFQKFEDMMRASGINIERKGNKMQLVPLTDAQVLEMSSGEVKNSNAAVGWAKDKQGEPKPIKDGIFDPRLTGGHGGKKWSHMTLPEPMPNPVFEGAIQKVLGLTEKQYEAVVTGEKGIKDGKVVSANERGAKFGGGAIAGMLEKVDLDSELKRAEKELKEMKLPADLAHRDGTQAVDKTAKKVRMLRALKSADMSPKDAYTIKNLPVMPPMMRPVSFLPSGDMSEADINALYTRFGGIAKNMKDPDWRGLPTSKKKEDYSKLYDGMRTLMGVGPNWDNRGKQPKGLLLQMAGKNPKSGYFQDTLLSRRQDMTMRGTITPEPHMSIDEVGLPTAKAMDLFRPFVVEKLQTMGHASSPREALDILSKERKKKLPNKAVTKALDLVMDERPVMLKRDPSLHKHSVQAFRARRAPGKAIQIHPLVTGGFNADFDGDTMAAYVPVGKDAVKEAFDMMPSKNIYNEASGKVMYTPSLDSSLGLYKLSRVTGDSKKEFKTHADLLKAAQKGQVSMTDTATVGGKKTTAGRVMLASSVPEKMSNTMLHDLNLKLDKGGVNRVYTQLAKEHKDEFGDAAGKLMNLGYEASFGAVKVQNPSTKGTAFAVEKEGEDPKKHVQFLPMGGTHSFGLKDFSPDKSVRDPIIKTTQKKVEDIQKKTGLSKKEKDRQITELWFDATEKIEKKHEEKSKRSPNNLQLMKEAGVKPSPDQYRQLTLAPMLLTDSANRVLPKPVTKSYSEGLDVGSYWNQMSGARRGSVLKVQEVQDPGYFTKRLMNVNMGSQVSADDCQTGRGVAMNVGDQNIYDRELAQDMKVKGAVLPRGTTLTPDVVQTIKAADKNANILVRSPLKCQHDSGICQHCAGRSPDGDYYKKGTNVGVLATQALGERSTQLTLKAFHSGGIAKRDQGLVNDFKRVLELTEMPKDIPNQATVAMKGGTITKVEKDPTGLLVHVGGRKHLIPKDQFGNPLWEPLKGKETAGWKPPKVGDKVAPGQVLSDPSRTNVNVRDLYKATNSIEKVQNHMVNELHGIYGKEGVRRQHVELAVKNMSNITRVEDPGDDSDVIKGDFVATSSLQGKNRELVKKGKKPVMHKPVLRGIDVMPREVQEDWMAKMNHNRIRQTVADAATYGQASELHGTNPIPGMAYGAEFGMTEKDKRLKPHLKDVPEWAY